MSGSNTPTRNRPRDKSKKNTVTPPQLRAGVRGSLPFFPFLHFLSFFHLSFFHFFAFFMFFFIFPPSPGPLPKTSLFSHKHINFKPRFWVRRRRKKEERRKKKEGGRTRRPKQVPFHHRTHRNFLLFACMETPHSDATRWSCSPCNLIHWSREVGERNETISPTSRSRRSIWHTCVFSRNAGQAVIADLSIW